MKMDSVFLYGVYRICSFESNIKSSFDGHNLKLFTIVEFLTPF
jgi:hypothetical protein